MQYKFDISINIDDIHMFQNNSVVEREPLPSTEWLF